MYGRDPCNFSRHWVTLRLLGKGQQYVHVIAQLVVAIAGDEYAAIFEQRNVGGVKLALLLDNKLNNAGSGNRAGGLAGKWFCIHGTGLSGWTVIQNIYEFSMAGH